MDRALASGAKGRGFEPLQARHFFAGPTGDMGERVKLIAVRLEVDFTSHGTTARVTIPLEKDGPCLQTPLRLLPCAANICISQ